MELKVGTAYKHKNSLDVVLLVNRVINPTQDPLLLAVSWHTLSGVLLSHDTVAIKQKDLEHWRVHPL